MSGMLLCTSVGANASHHSNSRVDALFAQAAATHDEATRARLYGQAQLRWYSMMPLLLPVRSCRPACMTWR